MIAVISDIHGNLEALESVLGDAAREGAERVICLGDVVGYGADPNACMERVAADVAASVLGNHDAAVGDLAQAESFNEVARAAIRWTAEVLRPEYHAALRALPPS